MNEMNFSFKDVYARCSGAVLRMGNSTFERVVDLRGGVPVTMELSAGGRRLAASDGFCDFSLIGINMPERGRVTDYALDSLAVREVGDSMFDGEHVEVEIAVSDKVQQVFFKRRYLIYPGLPVLGVMTSVICRTSPNVFWTSRGDLNRPKLPEYLLESCGDSLNLAPGLKPMLAVEFAGRTDYTNEQVIRHAIGDSTLCNGNLLFCDDGEGRGLFFLQEAMPSGERRDHEKHDFRFEDGKVYSCGWGLEPRDIGEEEHWSCRHVLGMYENDGSRGLSLLKQYLRRRFPVNVEKHCSVMVNPWGCGRFRALVSEDFLKAEMKAAGELCATHYQIDDGWQSGRTLQELEVNNRCADAGFWSINRELLPNGFEPVLECAREAGVKAELWVAPSANRHYRDWRQFADMLYDFHLSYGFENFKIDFVKVRSKEAQDNLENMLRTLRERSEGRIYFNLDTTNGQRPGYFMFLEYGNIFLENRYVCHNWGLGYHPDDTLRNLWNLSAYMRPQSLQIEFTDPGIINREFYERRGGTRPDVYDCSYWAAVAMFANPLVWLAPSLLTEEIRDIYRKMIKLHLKYRHEIFSGEIFPIGDEPSGRSISGLQSHREEDGGGMFIFYCEHQAPLEGSIKAMFLEPGLDYELTELTIDGEEIPAGVVTGAVLRLDFPATGTWRMFRYRRV